jgi:hypothetical protein
MDKPYASPVFVTELGVSYIKTIVLEKNQQS